jgi:membrane associated rhomboid family serine protease
VNLTRWVRNLLIANVAIYLVQLAMPGVTNAFMFVPGLEFSRPLTFVTYMFLHDPNSIWHIVFNMFGLYIFGPRVEQRMGSDRFLWLYFISGITGALLSMILAPNAALVGASAAIFGVVLAFARFWPTDKLYIWGVLPLEARWLVILTIVWAVISGIRGSTGGVADFAHIGGYAGAYLYLKWLEQTKGTKKFKQLAISPLPDRHLTNWKRVDMQSVHELNRDEVNRILDKINASGLGSLTPQEKQFLSNFVPPDDRATPPS